MNATGSGNGGSKPGSSFASSGVVSYRRVVFWAAVLTACAVLPLLLIGAGVTSKDAGMAYPDWPTSGGHLINPPSWWAGEATRWEHGHRLLGWTVGFLAIVLARTSWKSGGVVRLLGPLTLLAICIQGVLGGLRVRETSTDLAMIHGIWGQVCFCLASSTALLCSRTWIECRERMQVRSGVVLRRLCLFGTVAIFIQLVLGAALRHFSSGSALVAHILWAMVVVFVAGWLAMWVGGSELRPRILVRLGRLLGVLVAVQLVLGGVAWLVTFGPRTMSPQVSWLVPTLHVGVGSLVLVSSVLLTLSVYGLVTPAESMRAPVVTAAGSS